MAESFRVLLAVDSSEHADYAFHYYLENLHKDGNEVLLLHVAEMPTVGTMYMSGVVWEEVLQRERNRTKELEKIYREKLDQQGIKTRMLSSFGNVPGEGICETANDEGANMIVMGSRGMGKLRRTILGSVSDYVIHHAHCAVVVCKREHHHHHDKQKQEK